MSFPFPHYVDEATETVYFSIGDGGYPIAMAIPTLLQRHYPGYKGNLCSLSKLQSLMQNEQKES